VQTHHGHRKATYFWNCYILNQTYWVACIGRKDGNYER
jgi:hypothetical protein